ncbi:unnamed protein product [Medioppia subpectinata]|uniref:Uncharacterized protein n=1 Tax=Medioppia subpectinata TaxID=1979941 RepID=A0A7R9KP42_9ACAR|nr:unnamed protein product [Medioppia subpectinata]CAG2105776.1 unnamed protein product [Medioppia subpectinata]
MDEFKQNYNKKQISNKKIKNKENKTRILRIGELLAAVNSFNFNVTENVVNISDKNEFYRISKTMTDNHIRDSTKFSKGLVSFANTCPDDQLSLLKKTIQLLYYH